MQRFFLVAVLLRPIMAVPATAAEAITVDQAITAEQAMVTVTARLSAAISILADIGIAVTGLLTADTDIRRVSVGISAGGIIVADTAILVENIEADMEGIEAIEAIVKHDA